MQQTVMVVGILLALLAGPAALRAQSSSAPADLNVAELLGALQRDEQSAPPPRQDETPVPESGGAMPPVRDVYESAWRAAAQAARGVDLERAWQTLCQQLETSTTAISYAPARAREEYGPQGDRTDIATLCRQYSIPDEEQVGSPAGKVGGPAATAR